MRAFSVATIHAVQTIARDEGEKRKSARCLTHTHPVYHKIYQYGDIRVGHDEHFRQKYHFKSSSSTRYRICANLGFPCGSVKIVSRPPREIGNSGPKTTCKGQPSLLVEQAQFDHFLKGFWSFYF